MKLVSTNKIYTYHSSTLGVPPIIDNKRCIGIDRKDKLDIFEYCDNSEPQELVKINGIFFK
jgi:hypothetical protein